jgi:chemotaxis signal transduction protein
VTGDRWTPALTVDALRAEFDRAFAVAPVVADDTHESVLIVQVGGDPYALRLSQIAALFADKRVTWLPGPVRELLGVVAVRGAILPVYDLSALLGYAPASAPRWFVTAPVFAPDGASAGHALHVALAVERFDGHRRIAREAFSPSREIDTHTPHVREVVRVDELVRPLVEIPSVVDTIARLANAPGRRSIE